ncbi:hypothetical protein ACLOJK_032133 [Asimina triloba]
MRSVQKRKRRRKRRKNARWTAKSSDAIWREFNLALFPLIQGYHFGNPISDKAREAFGEGPLSEKSMAGSKCSEWKHVFAMVGVEVAFAIANILLKKVLDEGIDHLALITYRQAIAALSLAPIAFFKERKINLKHVDGHDHANYVPKVSLLLPPQISAIRPELEGGFQIMIKIFGKTKMLQLLLLVALLDPL